jgi:hypothetical protein
MIVIRQILTAFFRFYAVGIDVSSVSLCGVVCVCMSVFSLDNYVRDMFFTFSLAKILCVLSRDSLVASSLMSIAKRQKTFFYLVFAASLPQRLPLAISSSTLLGIVSVSIL